MSITLFLMYTISHIITLKSLIVVTRKPNFLGGAGELDRCDIIMCGEATWCDRGQKCWKKRDMINEWPLVNFVKLTIINS